MSLLEYIQKKDVPETIPAHGKSRKPKSKTAKPKIIKPKNTKLKNKKPNNIKLKTDKPENKKPSKLWYLLHVPLGFVSGPLCHGMWEDVNEVEAVKHLGHGIMLSSGTWIAVGAALLVSFV